jgi:hypothetical protein
MTTVLSSKRFWFLAVVLILFMLAAFPAAAFADENDGSDDNGQDTETECSAAETPQDQDYSPPAFEAPALTNYTPADSPQDLPAPSDSNPSGTTDTNQPTAGSSGDVGTTDPETTISGTSDTASGQESAPPVPIDFGSNDSSQSVTSETTPLYFQVAEVSMSPLLNPGDIIEIVSANYNDGDMVVTQTSDGKYVVKMLSCDMLVPLGAGVSYSATDVTILGKAVLSSFTAGDLEEGGLNWSIALATTAVEPGVVDPLAEKGTPTNPYIIATWQNLYWLNLSVNSWAWSKHFIQTDNIVFPDEIKTWNDSAGWNPIGNASTIFTGVYDGGDNEIRGLYINRPDDSWIGMFGYNSSAAVLKNIGVLNLTITGNINIGGLIGGNYGLITNCFTIGALTGNRNVGGLAGSNNGTITNSYAAVTVIGNSNYIGGLVGSNTGMVENSYASGSVSGGSSSTSVGGLIGGNSKTLKNSYAYGAVSGYWNVGGLVGFNEGKITDSYSTGSAHGENHIGSLVGYNWNSGLSNSGKIENSYAAGSVSGNNNVGGLVGFNNGGTIDDKSSLKTLAAIKNLAFHQDILGWDITGVVGDYPVLGWQVNWTNSTWYMGTPPAGGGISGNPPADSGFSGKNGGNFDFYLPPSTLPSINMPTFTGSAAASINPSVVLYGSWSDLNEVTLKYQAALAYLVNNRDSLGPDEIALLEVDLVITQAILLAMKARLLTIEGRSYDMTELQEAYSAAVAVLNANRGLLTAEQVAEAEALLQAIATVISRYST